MNPFIALVHVVGLGSALLLVTAQAKAQDTSHIDRRCLSIVDVNARVECFETGIVPSPTPTATLTPSPTGQQIASPSFDCRLARTSIERAICSDPTLSQWDLRMGQLLEQALQLARDRQPLLENQRLWLAQRNGNCSAVPDTAVWSCLLEATKIRVSLLEKAIVASSEANQISRPSPPNTTTSTQERSETVPVTPSAYATATAPFRTTRDIRPQNQAPQGEDTSFPIWFAASIVALIVLMVTLRARRLIAERKRLKLYAQNLVARYGDEAANRILTHQVWQGMTMEQLIESRGHPSDVEQEIKRERIKETWKYHRVGKNRFRGRIYLENGIVIGWKH